MKHKNFIKKTISFLTILCCLAGSLIPAYAAENGSGSGDASGAPRVTFTNEPNNSPDLFVNKVVENAVQGAQYAAPEHAAYRFVLKIGGEVAANEEYRLLDSEHGEITRKTSGGRNFSFKTDSTGVFTLEDGQQAWFEYVGTGVKYEVIELDTYLCPVTDANGQEVPAKDGYQLYDGEGNLLRSEITYQMRSLSVDGYRQVSPPGNGTDGASTGEKSILANGSSETFTNRYTGKGTGDKTVLEISKSVTFPAGYTVPETPDFHFRVELDGSPYAGKEYAVIDTASGNPVVDSVTGEPLTGMTDEEGCFTLKGGQTASFKEIPTELDYKVYELLGDSGEAAAVDETEDGEDVTEEAEGDNVADGNAGTESGAGAGKWWAVGSTEHKGSTQAPLTEVNFNNANVSFVVTKRMEDYNKPDVEFTFRLADEKNNAFAGAAYYVYNTTGVPVYDENGNQLTGRTDSEGSFKLKPGQSAVFTGIEPGKSFKVSEAKNPDYVQVLPLPNSDTTYTVPAGGRIPFVDFVNKPADNTGSLSVTKELTYKDGEGPLTNDDFRFVLYKQLKTEDDVAKAFGVVNILFFTIGSANGDDIEVASADGSVILVKAEISGGNSVGDSEISDSIRVVDGICYYEKDGALYELYAPAEDEIYSVPEGLSAPTYKTGSGSNAGEFSIKAGQTAQFDLLAAGYKYLVKEFGLNAEYTEVTAGSPYYKQIYVLQQATSDAGSGEGTGTGEDAGSGEGTGTGTGAGTGATDGTGAGGAGADAGAADAQYAQVAELTGSGLSFIFTNHYEAKKTSLNLTKVDGEGNAITDKPAHFMLYLDKGQENPVYEEPFLYTDDQGMITFPNLKAGTYWLYELKAPSGYRLLEAPIEIHIAWDEAGSLAVTIDGRALDADSDVVKDGHIAPGTAQDSQNGQDDQSSQDGGNSQNSQDAQDNVNIIKDTIYITVVNKEFYKLPSAGGVGIYWYSIGGMLLMMAAALILYKYKRTGEVQGD